MKKVLVGVISVILFSSCEKNVESLEPIKEYTFSIDSVLMRDGRKSLLKDGNGFYHLKIDTNTNQQSHRVTGRILVNGKEPFPPEKIEWESNLYWSIKRGDTVAMITKSYITILLVNLLLLICLH